ncbi:MAG: hypothetical protein ACJ72H_12255 [Candidatus Sulfotelmatobacter sp.]
MWVTDPPSISVFSSQPEGGPVEEIHPGGVIWFAPGEKHWHGAAPTTAITHIAIQERKDGNMVDWMEHVSDEQYRRVIGDLSSAAETHKLAEQVNRIGRMDA